jgi:hypothetical protein
MGKVLVVVDTILVEDIVPDQVVDIVLEDEAQVATL